MSKPGSVLFYFIILTVGFCSCENDEENILNVAERLFCQRQLLADSSQALWDDVAYHININLGAETDSITRKRMVEIKNAPIIKSFHAYLSLPDSIKTIVEKAEVMDKRLVDEIAEVSFSIDSLEIRKIKFLKKVGMESNKGRNFLSRYNEFIASPCKYNSTKTQ
ncbi:MAG TPA: hypothetical protein PLR22_10740 [Saprospiraceae bacterium]|nr:hypothetical protein [Saprospiraceae bacterium]